MAPQRQGIEEDTDMRPRLATSLGGESQVFVVDADGQAETAETPSVGVSMRGKSAEDDELTSLTWLQDCNLLQSIHVSGDGNKGQAANSKEGSQTGNGTDEEEDYQLNGVASGASSPVAGEVYNPAVHIYAKPPYSFSCLIFMAIEDSMTKALPVKDIYSWILSHFPYFQNAPTGWKNSVRHNLSLNKCFLKVDKGQNIAKGSLWCIEPEYRPNLLQALNKTPYNQYRHLRLPTHLSTLVSSISQNHVVVSPSSKPCNNTPNPDLFPFLSKRLGASKTKDPEVDAAATMLALKNGPRILKSKGRIDNDKVTTNGTISPTKERRLKRLQDRSRVPRNLPALVVDVPVITMSPSEDHTYSSTSSPHHGNSSSPASSIDEPFEFGHSAGDPLSDVQDNFLHRSDSGGDSGVTHSTTSTSDESMEDEDDYDGMAFERGNRVIVLPVSNGDRAKSLSEQCYLVERAPPSRARVARADDEERKKIAEGADALLNLAGYRTAEAKPRRRRKPSRGNLRHLIFDEAQR